MTDGQFEYYKVVNTELGVYIPVRCQHYQIQDGWVQFYNDDMEWIVTSVPPSGFFFEQITQEEYEELLIQQEADQTIDDEIGGYDEVDER